jgi:hypothetical protein
VNGAGFDKFGMEAGNIAGINVLHERAGKAVFHAEQDANLFHDREPPGEVREPQAM